MATAPAAKPSAAVAALILVAATALLYGPVLLHDALPVAPSGDTAFHAQAAAAWHEGRAEGALWPRWASAPNRGWGAPIFVFYPPVPHALAALLAPGGDVLAGLRLATGLLALLAGFAFFAVARTRVPAAAALAGALLYTLLPYRAIDLYQRFALAEFAAFVWIPLVFHFAARCTEAERPPWRSALALAVAAAGLALTHLVTAWMTGLVGGVYVAVRLAWRRRAVGACGAALAAAAVGAALLSAGYLVPALAQRDAAHLEYMTEGRRYDWRRNFVFRDETAHGYPRAPLKPWVNGAAASQLLVALAAFAAAAPLLRRRDAAALETGSMAAVAALAFALQVPPSAPLWQHVPELATVQFPWRFSGLQGFSACVLLATALARAGSLGPGRRRAALLAALAAATLPALALTGSALGAAQFRFDARAAAQRAGNVIFEYVPKGVAGWRTFQERPAQDVPPVQALQEGGGEARVHGLEWGAQQRRFTVESQRPVRLRVRTFHFPGWQARVDGAAVPLAAGGPQRALELALPAGRHEVALRYGPTPLRRAAEWTSAAAWVGAGVLALALRRRAHST